MTVKEIPDVKAAEDEVKKYASAEQAIESDLRALRDLIASTEGVVGEKILQAQLSGDTKTTGKISHDLNSMRDEVDLLERAIAAARAARTTAESNLLIAQAAVKRKEAADIRVVVSERLAKTSELIRQLKEHEEAGVSFVPELNAAQTGYKPGPVTKSQILNANALTLEKEADELERDARENQKGGAK